MNLQQSTLRTLLASLLGVLLGGGLLIGSTQVHPPWSTLLANVGAFVVASVVMALIFQFWQLRALLEDLFNRVQSAEQWRRSGISGFSASIYDNIPWDELFAESDRLSMIVAYARTWRNSHQVRLEEFVRRPETVLEVMLPDPEVEESMVEFGRRFNVASEEVRARVDEAIQFFTALGERAHANSTVRVYLFPRTLQFSFYRFNRRAVFASYKHRPGRGSIVTLLADRGGELYSWIDEEWRETVGRQDVGVRRVYPAAE